MAKSVWQKFIVDGTGNVLASASMEVRLESSGALATIYSSESGATLSNPFTAGIDGLARFYADAGVYKITATSGAFSNDFRYQQLGNSQSRDVGTASENLPTMADVNTAIVSAVVGLFDDRGNYDASSNTYPVAGGSGTAGAVLKGDVWQISVAGTLGGKVVSVGDSVRALIDSPAQVAANWAQIENNAGYVSENVANKATDLTLPDNTKYPSTAAAAAADNLRLTYADAFADVVLTGLVFPTSANLTSTMTEGVAEVIGTRVVVPATTYTFIASQDTYVDLSNAGVLTYLPVANAAAAPAVTANSLRLQKVVTDATAVTSVVQLASRELTASRNVSVPAPTLGEHAVNRTFVEAQVTAASSQYLEKARSIATPNATVPVHQLKAVGTETNIDVALTPKGAGALTAQVADNAVAGGNKRGPNAVDWQTSRTAVEQVASGTTATIGGGLKNTAAGISSTIGGGEGNSTSGLRSTVGGGLNNSATATHSTIGGGTANVAGGDATVGGGNGNRAESTTCTIGGGNGNLCVSSSEATIGGGSSNTAGGQASVIAGGSYNTTTSAGQNATIGGGRNQSVAEQYATICGGQNNDILAGGGWSTICGGFDNAVSANYSIVLNGTLITVSGVGVVGLPSEGAVNHKTHTAVSKKIGVYDNGTRGSTVKSRADRDIALCGYTTNATAFILQTAFFGNVGEGIVFADPSIATGIKSVHIVEADVIGSDGTDIYCTVLRFFLRSTGSNTLAQVGDTTVISQFKSAGATAWTAVPYVLASADTNRGQYSLTVTGEAAKNIEWTATLRALSQAR